ncbi:hypothetical protein D3C71_1732660 [compost metagenome]
MLQPFAKDDLGRTPCTIDKYDIRFAPGIVKMRGHGHHRRNTRSGRDEKIFIRRMMRDREPARRAAGAQPHPGAQIIEHPSRSDGIRLRLDRNGQTGRPRRRGRNRIGAVDASSRNRQFQREELPGIEAKQGA